MMTKRGATVSAAAVLLAMGVLGTTPARAADLGGDCCADLDERIAELEATSARKGNRKISMTISGRLDQGLLWYRYAGEALEFQSGAISNDDGRADPHETDVYVVDNGSRIRLDGRGELRPGTAVGYRLQLNPVLNPIGKADVFDAYPHDGPVTVGDAYVFIEHDTLGTLNVGNMDGAWSWVGNKNLPGAIYDGIGTIGGFDVDGVGQVGGYYGQNVRWDSPVFAGALQLSASWGADDIWSVAGQYGQEFNGLRVAASVGYEINDGEGAGDDHIDDDTANPGNDGAPVTKWGVSASIWHLPSGMHVSAHYGSQEEAQSNFGANEPVTVLGNTEGQGTHFYIQGGFAKDIWGIGLTNIFGEYASMDDFEFGEKDPTFATTDTATMWGIGIEQTLDAVSATAFLHYRRYTNNEAVFSAVSGPLPALDDELDIVHAGMRVNF